MTAAARRNGTDARSILFVNHASVPSGAELSLLDIATHLRDRCEVMFFSDGPVRGRFADAGVTTNVLDVEPALLRVRREDTSTPFQVPLAVLRSSMRLARHARRHDVIYANSQKAFVVAAIGSRLARRPLIWHLRDILSPEHFSPSHIRLVVQLAQWTTQRVIVNSEATRIAFIEAGGPADRVALVHNGIDTRMFDDAARAEGTRLREELRVGQAPLLGIFGRLSPWKGQHLVIRALAGLPDAHLLVVGGALFGEEQYAQSLQAMVDELGVRDRVHFAGFQHDVAGAMFACDIVLHGSVAPEAFGRVLVEAMLAGRPVIAPRAGGAMEIVQDRATGRLVPPGDVDAMRTAIDETLRLPDRGRALGETGRQRAEASFSLDAMLAGVRQQLALVGA